MRNYDLYSKNVFYKSMCYKTQRPNSATIFSCLVILHIKSLTRSYLDCTLGIWPLFVVVSEVIFSSPATKSINITAAVPFSRVPIRWRNFSCSCCCRRPHWSPCCGQPRLDTSVILHSFLPARNPSHEWTSGQSRDLRNLTSAENEEKTSTISLCWESNFWVGELSRSSLGTTLRHRRGLSVEHYQ